ncbi:MAG: aminotransferase class V-fold PLP-dependent enzyme [Armatimonadetes bacterium]|nr:aminotransferase class V-fold PLP-dependent enzyme [Armatimonadota bacterium]
MHLTEILDSAEVRRAFPVLAEAVYLNTGTYGLMPEPAFRQFVEILFDLEQRGVAAQGNLWGRVEAVRARVAALMGTEADEIAFTRNATDGINLVLSGLDWQAGDEVITTTEEHPAMHHPLLYLQKRRGIKIKLVEVSPQAEVMLARLESAASRRTRLVAISHVSSETGTREPAEAICRWAASRHTLSLLDGAQALGVFPIDTRRVGCDFYVSNGHKWLCGPKGVGIFFGRKDRLTGLSPAHIGAGSLERADIATGEAEPWSTALRFEFGTRAWPLCAGLGASLDWLESLGWEAVEQHMAALSGYLKERLSNRPGLRLLSPLCWEESSALTTFAMNGWKGDDLCNALRERWNIHVRPVGLYNAVRVSTAHFNCREDVDMLVKRLEELAG